MIAFLVNRGSESKIIEDVAHSVCAMQDWRSTLLESEVRVMKPEICKHFMYHNCFDVPDINCVIIDECHHAFGNYPLVSTCSRIKAHSNTKPLILAMTASLIPSKMVALLRVRQSQHIPHIRNFMRTLKFVRALTLDRLIRGSLGRCTGCCIGAGGRSGRTL